MSLSFIRHEQSPSQHSGMRRGSAFLALGLAGTLALGGCSNNRNEPVPESTGAQLDHIIATELQEGPLLTEGDRVLSVSTVGSNPTVQGIIREVAKNEPNVALPDTNAAIKASEASAAAIMSAVEETTGHAVLSREQVIVTWRDCDQEMARLTGDMCVILAALADDGSVE